jgi:hypothetical protein
MTAMTARLRIYWPLYPSPDGSKIIIMFDLHPIDHHMEVTSEDSESITITDQLSSSIPYISHAPHFSAWSDATIGAEDLS